VARRRRGRTALIGATLVEMGSEDPYREQPTALTLPPTKKHCFACASILDARAELCPRCGVRQPPPPSVALERTDGRTKVAAGLFGILLGGLGIHKFYLGQTGLGIVYLVFCWTFIPSLIGLVEGIVYLSMTDEDFAKRYG
jgi:TM2 domain-containing membrane protein YozV